TPLNHQAALEVLNRATNAAPTEIIFGHNNSSGVGFVGASLDMIPDNLSPGSEAGSLVFGTRTNGTSNVIEKMRITNNGRVGIGTQNPQQQLDVANGNLLLSSSASTPDTLM